MFSSSKVALIKGSTVVVDGKPKEFPQTDLDNSGDFTRDATERVFKYLRECGATHVRNENGQIYTILYR